MIGPFSRIAIVNRGEPAMRLIAAARELSAERDEPFTTIALYTEPDRASLFVREADEAYALGDATWTDPSDGFRKNAYLDYERLRRALKETSAEAVWVGWGFVAEHAAFADMCDELGVVFIGPGGDVMRRLGDKISSKLLAEEAEVPVAPWSGGPVESLEEAREQAERLGYPLMIKATSGGGGRGIRRVTSNAELPTAWESARNEARHSFGDETVFLERLVPGARHVEVQIVSDGQGTTWALGVRDCTIQRRHQKVLEETPSPALTEEEDATLRAASARLGQVAGYRNAGTVEYLYDPDAKRFSFMEVNARLQVAHPVTELCTGADLVKLQLHVAAGGRLEGEPPPARGHAIEVRVTAEAPERDFAPAPGIIERMRLPTGPGIRVDTGVAEGDEVAPQFDSMIGKVMAYGRDRPEAISRLRRALFEMILVLRDGASNKGFLLNLLDHPDVKSGDYDVGWLDRLTATRDHISQRHREVALVEAAIEAFEGQEALERESFYVAASRGRPQVGDDIGHRIELSSEHVTYNLMVRRVDATHYRVEVDGRVLDVVRTPVGDAGVRLTCGDTSWRALSAQQGADRIVEVNGVPHRIQTEGGGLVRAVAPGVVVSLPVEIGEAVQAGDRVAVLEAMKTEMSITAPFAGRVKRILASPNVQVPAGAPLVQIEAESEEEQHEASERIDFGPLTCAPSTDLAERNQGTLRSLLLGYDADARELARSVAAEGVVSPGVDPGDAATWATERELLTIFTDIAALFRREPGEDEHSDTEYLHFFARDPESKGEGLPVAFVERLRRALAHYGLRDLQGSPELREALFRLFKSRHHQPAQTTPLLSILQRWLDHRDALIERADQPFRDLLERFIDVTEGRFARLNDLAREVRYRYVEGPILEEARDRVYRQAEATIASLIEMPRADREPGIRELVDCPQPLKSIFSRRLSEASGPLREVMLEVLARRYYRIRELHSFRHLEEDGIRFWGARYAHLGREKQLFSCHVERPQLEAALAAAAKLGKTVPANQDFLIDFYVWRTDAPHPDDVDLLRRMLEAAPFTRPVRRAAFSISAATGGLGRGGVEHYTFRQNEEGFYEERENRGLHPMFAQRLELWRLTEFTYERLPSAEDVYLFRAVARSNPKDERLFALAEVRDLTAVKDEAGRVVGLPNLERMLMESLAAMRRFQSGRSERERLHWNRVRLFVRPPMTVPREELTALIHRLGPATRDLGLERIEVIGRFPGPDGELKAQRLEVSSEGRQGVVLRFSDPPTEPLQPLDRYTQKVVSLRRRGLMYPYEVIEMLTPRPGTGAEFPPGEFVEHDLDEAGEKLVPVERAPGNNRANVVAGLLTHVTEKHPEGMTRVILLGDPSRSMGSLAEPECRMINAALDLALEKGIPCEWIAVSAGAKIAMDSGTENMDWIADVLRRIVLFTQAGGELNIVVAGINVGAQPYWNAEATMLMHTKGILIQTAHGAMVLTGKQALDYSGGVSAEDNFGIGGFDRIMGPNGQSQYFAADLSEACHLLLRHYEHTYVAPGERFPRRAPTTDPVERDVSHFPHGSDGFATVGEVFSQELNPGRKKPFDIRKIMRAATDQDREPLARWRAMRDAEVAVVWDAHVGGYPVCMIGLESRPVSRLGYVPADGPERWTAGTLFPLSSKKVARAINSASGNRPVVVLANLSGFDGSPESMRNLQLEYGAEIGRSVVNFDGPSVFLVVSRYHGGAFVVFSNRLNPNLQVAAVEGAHASVIGGAPAAAVVFAREVRSRTTQDPRVQSLEEQIQQAQGAEKVRLSSKLSSLMATVHSEKLGEVADEFDSIHSVHRAKEVGSVQAIIPPTDLRSFLVRALESGMERSRS
ncbi:MAG: carboxyl transferase domain-containing protein [Sandaracinaceae bacterium]